MNTDSLPVSVFVTPRLAGADELGAFPDWLQWTRRVKENGLTLTLRCSGNEHDVTVDPQALDPNLWESLFDEGTFVRSFEFDYSGKPVMSYSVRQALSVLKSMYQQAGISLALPEESGQSKAREPLRSAPVARRARCQLELAQRRALARSAPEDAAAATAWAARGDDPVAGAARCRGSRPGTSSAAAKQAVAIPFSVFHHMPTPKDDDDAGPSAQPGLGYGARLPPGACFAQRVYVAPACARHRVRFRAAPRLRAADPPGQYATLSVSGVGAGWDWSIQPQTPDLETACVHLALGDTRLFLTAPRMLDDPTADVPPILGLLDLSPLRFGLAQVDVDGGMHKAIIQAETGSRSRGGTSTRTSSPTLRRTPRSSTRRRPFRRCGRAASLSTRTSARSSCSTSSRSRRRSTTLSKRTDRSHGRFRRGSRPRVSARRLGLPHQRRGTRCRDATYKVENGPTHASGVEEGFVQLAVMQPAPGAEPPSDDLYLHEAVGSLGRVEPGRRDAGTAHAFAPIRRRRSRVSPSTRR